MDRLTLASSTISLLKILEALAKDLRTHGEIDLSECFIDGTFIVAKKGS